MILVFQVLNKRDVEQEKTEFSDFISVVSVSFC